MKKYIFFLVSLCCALLPAMADQPEHPELKASDANIIGHVLDKKTGEHLSYRLLDYLYIYLDKEKVFYLLHIVYEHLFLEPLPIVKTALHRLHIRGNHIFELFSFHPYIRYCIF